MQTALTYYKIFNSILYFKFDVSSEHLKNSQKPKSIEIIISYIYYFITIAFCNTYNIG